MKFSIRKIRFPRKVMLVISGVLLLGGASAAFAIYSVKGSFLGGDEDKATSASGLSCTTIETLKMRRNGQRWIRKYISVDAAAGLDRVRTALRISGQLVKAEKADLYHVVVLESSGPTNRAARRGLAIGAEVLFSPDPARMPGMTASFMARYREGQANTAGMFHGEQVELAMDDIQSTMTAMNDMSDCFDPAAAADAAAHVSAGSEAGAHGDVAKDPAHSAEDEGTPPDHAPSADSEGAAEELPHGEQAEDASAPPSEPGFVGKMLAMIMGPAEDTAPAEEVSETKAEEPAGH